MSCPGCEKVPKQPQGAGTLYILPAQPHAAATIVEALVGDGLTPEQHGDSILAVPVEPGALNRIMALLGGALTPQEQAACQANFFADGGDWSPRRCWRPARWTCWWRAVSLSG